MSDEIAKVSTSRALAEVQVPQGTGELDNVPWLLSDLEAAERARDFWEERVEELRELLRKVAGDNTELKLNGKVEYTYESINRLRGNALKKDHPDIYQAYLDVVPTSVFNLDLFRTAKPDLFKEYQTRVLKKKS